jgi:Zn-dependent protease
VPVVSDLLANVLGIGILMASVILHEVAHGYTALRLGDPTAHYAGRLTLNPLKHIDPFGTVILPLLLIFLKSSFLIGWAKPVPVNPALLRDPQRGMMLVSAAGPLTNIALALVAALPLRILLSSLPPWLLDLLVNWCIINIFLALFNLVPVPPLDGSKLVAYFLPPRMRAKYESITPYGLLVIIGLLFLGLMDKVILPLCHLIFSLLVKG